MSVTDKIIKHPVLVKGLVGGVLGVSANTALILGLHIHDLVVGVCIAVALGILSALAVNVGLPAR